VAEAARILSEGCLGLEDAFDRLPNLTELLEARLQLAQAELRAGHREAALAAMSSSAVLAQLALSHRRLSRGLRRLVEEAQHRLREGPHGSVRVTSVVLGQAIAVDGQPGGVTPQRFNLPAGRHFIWVQTPLGPIPYRFDLREGESLRVGLGELEDLSEVPDESTAEPATHAARRPVLPHRER
jgi:hypothetical protein